MFTGYPNKFVFPLIFLLLTACGKGPSVKDLVCENPDKRGNALAALIGLEEKEIDKLIPPLIKTLNDDDSQ
ncbi:hypothetical protein BVX98_07835, partial [bacterium F11]